MEPAIVVCAGIAAITLALGLGGALPTAVRKLATIKAPIPTRPIAAALMAASFVVLVARPRPAAATIPPPIVRLTAGAEAGTGDAIPAESGTTVTAPSAETTAPMGGQM